MSHTPVVRLVLHEAGMWKSQAYCVQVGTSVVRVVFGVIHETDSRPGKTQATSKRDET